MLHMSQICYKMEIVRKLLNKKVHIRGLAKELNTNAMTIIRKVNQLLNENVIDYTIEGRNKVFYLKDTIETKSHILMVENYILLRTLGEYPTLRKVFKKIQDNKRIKLAVLFGSYTKSMAKKESDIDIFIESDSLNLKKELNLIDPRINIKIGKLNKENRLVKEIEKNHVIIKGFERYYEKTYFLGKDS